MGLNSVGLFMEGLQQCIEDMRVGSWEKRWKEKGRSFSMVRVSNRAGCFLRLGVVDVELKRYSICIPKGKGDKGGWTAMVEALRQMDITVGKKNLSNEKGEDLENLGWKMAKAWGLKGKMGIASMGGGRCLSGFRAVESKIEVYGRGRGKKGSVGEDIGLPALLWVPSVLRRVGDACGGFLDVDPKTESMEDLQWARILIRSDGVNIPRSLVIGIEEMSYSLSLWWEALPVLRQDEEWKRGLSNRPRGEVSGDEAPRAGSRVEEMVGARFEAQRQSEDGTGRLTQDEGSAAMDLLSQVGLLRGLDSLVGSAGPGQMLDWAVGPSLKSGFENPKGDQIGPRQIRSLGWAADVGLGHLQKGKATLTQAHLLDNGPLLKTYSSGLNGNNKDAIMEHEFIRCREEEMGRRQ
ncbi:hypothetical protein CK203_111974 [Vitis vinifera]|uniref:Uncharacterized protein n=1 Tax=Vitis vinifera TaxID=29760 RepID=A0A438DNX5_VITVI|nr:hypothetical protein CK203_111974 [Vitis vinifera]